MYIVNTISNEIKIYTHDIIDYVIQRYNADFDRYDYNSLIESMPKYLEKIGIYLIDIDRERIKGLFHTDLSLRFTKWREENGIKDDDAIPFLSKLFDEYGIYGDGYVYIIDDIYSTFTIFRFFRGEFYDIERCFRIDTRIYFNYTRSRKGKYEGMERE
jgi:hypothetical protein